MLEGGGKGLASGKAEGVGSSQCPGVWTGSLGVLEEPEALRSLDFWGCGWGGTQAESNSFIHSPPPLPGTASPAPAGVF